MLPAALLGISRFAHLVNIDFFKDLLATLRTLILRDATDDNEDEDETDEPPAVDEVESIRHRLMCIVTAFELLSGQGMCSDYAFPSPVLMFDSRRSIDD